MICFNQDNICCKYLCPQSQGNEEIERRKPTAIKIERILDGQKVDSVDPVKLADIESVGSESDSGLGSVCKSISTQSTTSIENFKQNQSFKIQSEKLQHTEKALPGINTSIYGSNSDLSDTFSTLSSFKEEKGLVELMTEEFKKNKYSELKLDTIFDGFKIETKSEGGLSSRRPLMESTPEVPSTPEINIGNRQKKLTKKRRMIRKCNPSGDESTSISSESDRDEKYRTNTVNTIDTVAV